MSSVIAWIAAEAEQRERSDLSQGTRDMACPVSKNKEHRTLPIQDLPVHQFPAIGRQNPHPSQKARRMGHPEMPSPAVEETPGMSAADYVSEEFRDREQERRTYRGRTVAMLRRYMRYSIETGRLPSLLGREFFRAKVTSYSVVTFEDRVIFVHDMETCLERLDEFSQQLIARHILQEHDRRETAKLLHCNEKTVRRLTPLALDQLSEILLDMRLMERLDSMEKNSCQGGWRIEIL